MKCAYHTVGVIYDTVEVAVTLIKIGVINTSQCHILRQIFMCSIEQVNFAIFSYDIANEVWIPHHWCNIIMTLKVVNTPNMV